MHSQMSCCFSREQNRCPFTSLGYCSLPDPICETDAVRNALHRKGCTPLPSPPPVLYRARIPQIMQPQKLDIRGYLVKKS